MKKILFITGTRADFGKLKPLMKKIEYSDKFELFVFVTGMHMLSKYGSTIHEVIKENYKNIYPFNNQYDGIDMDIALSNTISGLGYYVKELKPDMIIVHGDRIEALSGAIVGTLNNILVAHIEGGEISGTVDEILRHSITKLSHIHFVSDKISKNRIIKMGENANNIFVIGSPDIEIMLSNLPKINFVKKHYNINFKKYSIFCYHPVTTELKKLKKNIKEIISALIKSNKNYIVILPNNDHGNEIIIKEINKLKHNDKFIIFPSLKFEYYLTLLKYCEFIIGNSSVGVRSTNLYNIPSINIGTRQNNRSKNINIINVNENCDEILQIIKNIKKIKKKQIYFFGKQNSSKEFYQIINDEKIWKINYQKQFIDI